MSPAARRIGSAASRRFRNSATIACTACSTGAPSVSAASAACCETVAAFEVVCDWNAFIAFARGAGEIVHPIRHPVIAYAFATPFTTTRLSRRVATSSAPGAGASYAIRT